MTRYRRQGHWRKSPGGGRHWVNTHNVTRSSGRSFLSPRPSYTSRSYTPSPAPPRVPTSASVGWIDPNARCPVCGAAVFFYANRNGSRVFFDDLGPPWPKHPCTDNGMARPADCRAPSRRDFNAVRSPSDLRDRRWKSYAVREIVVEKGHSRIVLQPLNGSGAGPTWTVAGQVPLRVDDLVFTRAQQMSYFDTAVGEPVVVEDAKRAARVLRRSPVSPLRSTPQPAPQPSQHNQWRVLAGFAIMLVWGFGLAVTLNDDFRSWAFGTDADSPCRREDDAYFRWRALMIVSTGTSVPSLAQSVDLRSDAVVYRNVVTGLQDSRASSVVEAVDTYLMAVDGLAADEVARKADAIDAAHEEFQSVCD